MFKLNYFVPESHEIVTKNAAFKAGGGKVKGYGKK